MARPSPTVRASERAPVEASPCDPNRLTRVVASGDTRRNAVARPSVTETMTAGTAFELLGETEQDFGSRVDLVPATLAKGLEFDHVVLLEPAAVVAGEPDRVTGLRRLYVCLTRAVSSLVVVHADELPAELAA